MAVECEGPSHRLAVTVAEYRALYRIFLDGRVLLRALEGRRKPPPGMSRELALFRDAIRAYESIEAEAEAASAAKAVP